MDLDQLQKRMEWLEGERRKDKAIIDTLEKRIADFESSLPKLQDGIKDINSEVVRLTTLMARFDQLDANLSSLRIELTRSIEGVDRMRVEHDREVDKARLGDLEVLNKSIAEVRKGLDPIPDLKKALQVRVEEDYRLGREIEELEVKLVEGRRSDEEYRRSQKMLEEGQRQDAKRIADLQGEVTAVRKRLDEQRGKVDLVSDSLRKIDTRIADIQSAETERRQAQSVFIDRQNMAYLERERIWKDWQTRFEVIERQAAGLDNQLQTLEATHRSVKRAQEAFEEISQRFERRINEITEMQRLTEERFRQEWVAFRADDQKRWTSYSLMQEEQQREMGRQFERFDERVTQLEDLSQDIQDLVQLINTENQKRLQSLLAMAHEWMEENDRAFGRGG
jgi:chromosome segregation ATPase